jgi:hypothetical protein
MQGCFVVTDKVRGPYLLSEMKFAGRLFLVIGLLGGLLGACAPAFAQMLPARVIESVDVKVLSQGTVMIGRISDARIAEDGAVDISVAVEEFLKGAPQSSLRIGQQAARTNKLTADELSRMSRDGTRLLITGQGVTPLDEKTLAVPTASGLVLREPTKVIDYIREVLRSHPIKDGRDSLVNSFEIPLPKAFENTALSPFFVVGGGPPPRNLSIPVNAQLEKWALEWIRGRQEPIRGLQALRFFKTDANIALVSGLLSDPTFEVLNGPEDKSVEIREYRIRSQAYSLLKEWKVEVLQPIGREEVPRFEGLEAFIWQGEVRSIAYADPGVRWRKVVELSKNLKRVTMLSGTSPSEEEVALIAGLPTVTTVTLGGSNKTDGMLRHVARLPNLEQLDLANTRITDKGLASLASAPQLISIDLTMTRVTDEGLKRLAGISTLRSVKVALTQVTEKGIAEVLARRPDLAIEWERSFRERNPNIYELAQRGDVAGVDRALTSYESGQPVRLQNPNFADSAGNSPLIYAVAQNQIGVATLLLESGANANFQDIGKSTALHWATRHGYEDMMRLLIAHKANVNHRDEDGNTALHVAVEKGARGPIRILMGSGSDLRSRNAAGLSPLDLASRLGNPQVQEILRSTPTIP